MGIAWKDYLKRKGTSVQDWIAANKIASKDDLQAKVVGLDVVLTPAEIREAMKHVGSVGQRLKVADFMGLEHSTVEQPSEKPKRKKKADEPESV